MTLTHFFNLKNDLLFLNTLIKKDIRMIN